MSWLPPTDMSPFLSSSASNPPSSSSLANESEVTENTLSPLTSGLKTQDSAQLHGNSAMLMQLIPNPNSFSAPPPINTIPPRKGTLISLKESTPNSPLGVSRMVQILAKAKQRQLKKSGNNYSSTVLKTPYLECTDANQQTFILKDPLDPLKSDPQPTGRFNFITLPAQGAIEESGGEVNDLAPDKYTILVSPHQGAKENKAHAVLSDSSTAVLHAGMLDLKEGKLTRWDNGSSSYAVEDTYKHQAGLSVEFYQNYEEAYQYIAQEAQAEQQPRAPEASIDKMMESLHISR